jgi:hypothetical protein
MFTQGKIVTCIAITAILFAESVSAQGTYYYKGTGALNSTSNWGTNTDGTGSAPPNFTNILCTYVIRNTSAVTLSSNWTVSGLLSGIVLGNSSSSPVTLTIASGVTLSGALDIADASSGGNTIVLQSTSIPSFGSVNSSSTIKYDGTSAQSVSILTYGQLIISNTGVKTLSGSISVTSGLTVESGATLDGGSSTISRSGSGTADIIINGTFSTSNTSGFSGSSFTAVSSSGTSITLGSSSIIEYASSSSSQSISARTDYGTVRLIGNSNKTTQGTTIVSGNINLNAGTLTNNQVVTVSGSLTGSGAYTSSSGTLNLAGDFSNSGTLSLSGTSMVHYNGTAAQSVRGGTYADLTFSNTGTKTFAGAIAIIANRTMLVNSTAVVNAGTNQITATGATAVITINGTFITADPDGLSGSAATAISSTNTSLTPFTTTSTINYNATSGNQIITAVAPDSIYGNLVLSGGSLKTTAGNFYMLGGTSLTLDAGTSFNMGTRNIRRSGVSGTVTFNINGTFYTALAAGFSGNTSTAVHSTGTSIILGSSSVIHYTKSTAQTVSSRSDYVVLRLSGAGDKTADGPITVNDSLNIMENTFAIDQYTLTVKNKIGGAGTLTGSASSNMVLDGSAAGTLNFTQTSSATRTLNALTINTASGITLGSAVDVAGLLTLSTGVLTLNGQTLTLGGSVSATSGSITAGATSSITINGTGSFGTIPFTPGSQSLNNFTVNRTSSGSVTLGNDLTIGGALTITSGKLVVGSNTLTINGNILAISASDCFSLNGSSSISIGGSGALTASAIYFDQTSATTRSANNVTLNRSGANVTLGNALLLIGTLTLSNGTLTTGGNLTLVSTASATARVAAITGTGAISGNVTAQRYVPAVARRWRFMSSCISNATLEDWRSEIFITGAGTGNTAGTLNSNGFDATVANSPGVYYYNEAVPGGSNTGWVGVTNNTSSLTNVPLTVGKGYRVFIRGDRSDLDRITDVNLTQNEVLLDLTGPVNTGDISLPVSYTNTGSPDDDGWCLVGNPYPCPYDWNAFWDEGTNYTNIDPTIYVYDPASNGYKSYNANSSGSLTDGIIAQGQSFFVKATGASPSLTLKEQFKSTGTPLYLYKTAGNDEVRVRLKFDSMNYDDYILKFVAAASKHHDLYDIVTITGAVSLSSYASDSIYHSLDARAMSANTDTVLFKISAPSGTLSLIFNQLPGISGKYFFLHDMLLDSIQPLNEASIYTFNIQSSVPASYGNKRFRMIIGNQPFLPVKLLDFDAQKQGERIKLFWTTASEQNSSHFGVERSTDGKHFFLIASVKASGNSTSSHRYEYFDENPLHIQTSYYRLKQVSMNTQYTYSEVRVVSENESKPVVSSSVWPNPAGRIINISPYKLLDDVGVYSMEGKSRQTEYIGQKTAGNVALDISEITPGVYMLRLQYADGDLEHVKIEIE